MKKLVSALFAPRVSYAVLVSAILVTGAIVAQFGARAPSPERRMAEQGVAPLGAEVATELMSLRVESVREDPVGAPPYVPREGYSFVIPTFTVRNLSSTTRDLIPTLALYIKDDEGNVYNMAVAPLDGEGFGGPIPGYDKVRQEMAFEVRKSAKHLVLYFETGGKVMRESLEKAVP